MDPVAFYTHGLCALPHLDAAQLGQSSPEHVYNAFHAPSHSRYDVRTCTRFRVCTRVGQHRVPVGPVHTLAVNFTVVTRPHGFGMFISCFAGIVALRLQPAPQLDFASFFTPEDYRAPQGTVFPECGAASTLPEGHEHAYAPLVVYAILEMIHTAFGDLEVTLRDRMPQKTICARLWDAQRMKHITERMSPMLLASVHWGRLVTRLDFWELYEQDIPDLVIEVDSRRTYEFMRDAIYELEQMNIVDFVDRVEPPLPDSAEQVRLLKLYLAPPDPNRPNRPREILRGEQRGKTMAEIRAETWARHLVRGWSVPAIKNPDDMQYKRMLNVWKMMPCNALTETPDVSFPATENVAADSTEADVYHILRAINQFRLIDAPVPSNYRPLTFYDSMLTASQFDYDTPTSIVSMMRSMRAPVTSPKVHQIMDAAAPPAGDNLPPNAAPVNYDDGRPDPGAKRQRMFARIFARACAM